MNVTLPQSRNQSLKSTVCNILLILIAYSLYQVRSEYVINMNLILYTVFRMFVDFKLGATLYRDNI